MKTKSVAILALVAVAVFHAAAAHAQLKLTGARVFGVTLDGKRDASNWNTLGADSIYNVYLFTGPSRSPHYLNRGNKDDSLNPRFNLPAGTYTIGFAGDTKPCAALNLELCFNDDPQARISVTARDGGAGEFSGTTTFSTSDATVTLTAIQTFSADTDLVGPYDSKTNGVPDVGGTFTLVVAPKQAPPANAVTLTDFKLTGDLSGDNASFTLSAIATVQNAKGGALELLSGPIALTEIGTHPKWELRAEQERYIAGFNGPGKYPITLKFNAAVRQSSGWSTIGFRVAQSALQPIVLRGLAADTQFEFSGAARPERKADDFVSFLPSDGAVKLAWKEARKTEEGKLFYAAEMRSQISVSPGLMRQVALMDFKVMQGELGKVSLLLHGAGEVTRVQGDQVLSWKVEAVPDSKDRRLLVQLNQPQKDAFALQVQMQTPLGAFPQTTEAMRVQPEGATRFAGYLRVVNAGAVRLEVTQASGLSQVSPEQFPESDATRAALRATGTQRFAYRFSSDAFALQLQADQILPELIVSEVMAFNLGQNELAIDAELEVDVREAPLRELLLRVPKGYALARITASGMSDYFLRDAPEGDDAELRLIYGQPVLGRQVVQLRLEQNKPLGETNWALPRIDVPKAKSVRGNVGVASDAGFRLTAERTQALTEMATAFFPRKVGGLQAAFRLSEPAWSATMRVERLPQTVQADGLHLFSIAEGVAFGSSVINYMVSGAPMASFRVGLSDEYSNVEFTGKDIRNWQKATNGTGYVVQLHTPVSGAYTLLATYDRPFKSQGDTLTFTGARPLDAQSDTGHTLITSTYQFNVQPVDVSPGLLPLETGEVPPEYRLFFDTPILRAYRYTSRPYRLKLALSRLAQGDSLSQVVDRASLVTEISKEGQLVTTARYYLKNRGNPSFRLTLPPDTELWSATVNKASVVPVKDAGAYLIPLPQRADPSASLEIEVKTAGNPKASARIAVGAPIVGAPVMLAEWQIKPDEGQRLSFIKGSLTPVAGLPDISGFAQLLRMFSNDTAGRACTQAGIVAVMLLAALVVWRWTRREGVYRYNVRHVLGTGIGLLAVVVAVIAFAGLLDGASQQRGFWPREVSFLAPVQQAGSALSVEVANISEKDLGSGLTVPVLLVLLGIGAWVVGFVSVEGWRKSLAFAVGWTMLAWAALQSPNGAGWFFAVLAAFLVLRVLLPALRALWSVPTRTNSAVGNSAAPAMASVILIILSLAGFGDSVFAAGKVPKPDPRPPVPESVKQQIRVEDEFALVTAKIHWQAERSEKLTLLGESAVLTRVLYPKSLLSLVQAMENGKPVQQLVADRSGACDIEMQYQVRISRRGVETGVTLPTQSGLVNEVQLTVNGLDVDALSAQAVSVNREMSGSNTVAMLVLTPGANPWIGWKPRSRDVKREKAVFYAEVSQLYAPSAGVIEGAHIVAIRPAQGELGELLLNVPNGATITDVADASKNGSVVSLWRFDPDTRKLRVTLNPAQSRPFALLVRSQVATGPLPLEQSVGLLSVENAANEIGVLGVATGNEVQLDGAVAAACSAINLEDFPGDATLSLTAQIPGLTVRRAFRYADAKATVALKASPVEPDVRVEMQDTLSLGEDRTVLAANATVEITRAGIFRLSFLMPAGFDVESISGETLSHWTELKTDAGRIITLNLRGKTEGHQQFVISLAGPGVKASRNGSAWSVPQVIMREAGKQQGTLLVVPEQGMQLQGTTLDGVSQLDPQRAGIRQKGVLAFRVLQTPWNLALRIEQVDPWIQVTGLEHATVNEAQVKVAANLQYQIENTGLKALRVFVPTNAESVHFEGEQVADFLPVAGTSANGLQLWEVKLQRRIIGQYLLSITYQTLMAEQSAATTLRGVQAADVNLQRGFVTVQAGGRLQVRVDAQPTALQPTEWQSIPRALQQNLKAASANFAYRLVEPAFELPLKLDRHDAAKLLPARVNNITFTSVISDSGAMLTQVKMEMLPGDKRLLSVTLPKDASFWFAFVNQNGVWPWREKDEILIPLEQQSRNGQPVPVELFFSGKVGGQASRGLSLELLAPKFDLPLENIKWQVYLSEKWQLKDWAGTVQLQQQEVVNAAAALDLNGYLQNETAIQRVKTREAEQMLALGNSALAKGDPQQARRAFQSAFGLSAGDLAFNEDARVQLHNLKLQQALVGLNVRQSAAAGDAGAMGNRLREMRAGKDLNYTQQDAKEIIDRNSADDNSAYLRLAEKLIQQQDAAVSSASAIRASIPEQGRLLTFQRSVAVELGADLRIGLQMRSVKTANWQLQGLILGGVLLMAAVLGWMGNSVIQKKY